LAETALNLELCTAQCVDWQMYHTDRTGDWEIWAMGNIQGDPNLSQGVGADDMAPSRSPNSNYIAFTSNRDGNWELYIGRADGSLQERVTFNTIAIDTDPYWGPTNAIVYESSRDGNWNLFIFNPLTGEDLRVTNDLASDINAAWSPDGTHLIFQSNRDGLWQIYRLDLATLQVTRLSDGTARDFDPVYSNAGDKIAFRRYVEQPDGTFSAALFLMNPDGTGVEQISSEGGEPNSATWSPNDRYIAYQSDLDGDLDIYVYDTQSGETRQLTDNTIRDYAPAWLCSGDDQLLFTSEIEGNPDIFQAQASPVSAPPIDVMTEAIQHTDEPDNDVYPADTPLDEDASREGQLPQTKGDFGQQTEFLLPDMTITLEDSSIVNPEWQPLDSCGAPFAFRNSLSAQPSQRRGGQGGLGLRR
jgi:TolB protein